MLATITPIDEQRTGAEGYAGDRRPLHQYPMPSSCKGSGAEGAEGYQPGQRPEFPAGFFDAPEGGEESQMPQLLVKDLIIGR